MQRPPSPALAPGERVKKAATQLAAVGAAALFALPFGAAAQTRYDIEIVNAYPHDPKAFTQGLFFKDGALYESTGLKGQSSLRRVKLETGEVLQMAALPKDIFGEGVAPAGDAIIGLTWRTQIGFVFDAKTFKVKRRFTYAGEGWGLASDGKRLIMSDGTDELRFLNPKSLKETGRLKVTRGGRPLRDLNELEWVEGEIFANVWRTDEIVRIDPKTGAVVGVVDARALRAAIGAPAPGMDVLNGIAYDAAKKRLFLTGKNWPKLFEVRLQPHV
jgi:glutamine cyclotransferase